MDGTVIAIGRTAARTAGKANIGSHDEDQALVAAAQQGSEEAVEALVRRHWRAAHRAAFLIVQDAAAAEDVAQDSMLAAIDALDRFDNGRPLAPWLHRIVVNNALKWVRAAARRREVAVYADPECEASDPAPEISDHLLLALRTLDADQRAVVVMRYLLEFTPGEIAGALEVPRGTVNSRLRRALDRLGKELDLGRELE